MSEGEQRGRLSGGWVAAALRGPSSRREWRGGRARARRRASARAQHEGPARGRATYSASAASQCILRRSVASRRPRRVMYLPRSRSASAWLTVSSRGPPPPPLADPHSSDVSAGESVTSAREAADVATGAAAAAEEEEDVERVAAADAPVMCFDSAPATSNMPRRSHSKSRRMAASQRIWRPSCRPCARACAHSRLTASPRVRRRSDWLPPERSRASAGAHTRGTCTRGVAVRRFLRFFLRRGGMCAISRSAGKEAFPAELPPTTAVGSGRPDLCNRNHAA